MKTNKKYNIFYLLKGNISLVGFVAAIIVVSIFIPSFLTTSNIFGLFSQISIYGVAAMGMTFAIISGEFDMSMGSVLSMSSLIMAYIVKETGNIPVSIIAGILIGSAVGIVNGLFIVKAKVNTFIVTLGTLIIVKGIAALFCEMIGSPSSIVYKNDFLYDIGNSGFFSVPYLVIIFLIFIVITEFVLKQTTFGRNVYAIGGNQEVARISGIDVGKNKMLIFLIAGTSAGIAGVLMSAKMLAGMPLYAQDLPLTAVSSAVLGGNSLAGGKGSAFKTLLGLLIISLISKVFNLLSVSVYLQNLIKGLIILIVVVAGGYLSKHKSK